VTPPAEDRATAAAATGRPIVDVEPAESEAECEAEWEAKSESECESESAAAGVATGDAAAAASFVERLLGWLLPGTNPAGAIYGMIAIGALLAAESGLRDTYLETLASALIALALYWLAHAYADMLGQRLEKRARLTAAGLGRTLLHDWAIMRGGAVPLLVLLACWTTGVSQETAITVDLWVTAGCLLAYELLAGLRARSRPGELLLEGCVGAAMGLGILALRVILH
jgi:hypothetical protein